MITYQVGDPDGGVSTGRLVIQILEPIPLPPIAVDDFASIVGPGVATRIDVLANDSDPDTPNSALTDRVGDQDQRDRHRVARPGRRHAHAGRRLRRQPRGDLPDLRRRRVCAPSATVTLQVLEPLNRAPIARDDTAQLVGGDVVDISVLFNDDEPDGDPLTLSITAAPDPALGSAQVRPGGIIRFASHAGRRRHGDDRLPDRRRRTHVQRGPAGVDPPVRPGTARRPERVPPDGLHAADRGRPRGRTPATATIVDVGAPLLAASGVVTPAAGENGNIVFDYSVVNICRQRDTGTVTIDVNQDPVAQPYQTSMGRTEQRSIPVSDLATDAEPLTIAAARRPAELGDDRRRRHRPQRRPERRRRRCVRLHGDGPGPGRVECRREHPDRARQPRAGRQRRLGRRLRRRRHVPPARQRHRSRRRRAAAAVVPADHHVQQRQPGNGHGRRHRSAARSTPARAVASRRSRTRSSTPADSSRRRRP